MAVKFANNAATTLASSISSGATSFSVASASGFPALGGSDHMYVTIASEVVKVTAVSGTTFTCDATSGGHSAGDTVEIRVSAELLNDFATDQEALPVSGGQMTGNITMSGSETVDGRDLSVDGAKLDGIEAGATADQTNAEIKTAYEANSDTNAFTDADHTKLDGIEASATADQTDAEIRAAVEAASDSNVFTDADHTKLNSVASSANNYVHPNHSGEVTSTADGATVIADNVVDEANLKVSNTPTNGYFLSAQSGNTGGMTWAEVDALPSQTSNSGKYLTTDGTNASWAVLDTDANTTTKGLYEHAHTISSNYTISSGNNAISASPITINSGVSLTIPSGSTFVIV